MYTGVETTALINTRVYKSYVSRNWVKEHRIPTKFKDNLYLISTVNSTQVRENGKVTKYIKQHFLITGTYKELI